MDFEIVDIFTPAVKVGNRKLTPASVPESKEEQKVIAVLREFLENGPNPLYSRAIAELILWERIQEVVDG